MPIPRNLHCPYTESPAPEKIKALRFTHGISQAEAAHLVGVSSATVCNWEAARTTMPVGLWELLNWKCQVINRRRLQALKRVSA